MSGVEWSVTTIKSSEWIQVGIAAAAGRRVACGWWWWNDATPLYAECAAMARWWWRCTLYPHSQFCVCV